MRHIHFALALAAFLATSVAHGACAEKRTRGHNFMLLSVPENAPRPKGPEDFSFVTADTTFEQLTAKVGPPDAADGQSRPIYVYCLADGREVTVRLSKDGTQIESVSEGRNEIFKRKRK
jgi:hypothetical protein